MNQSLYEYVLITQPDDEDERARILTEGVLLATNQKTAVLKVARSIPNEWVDRLDEVQIVLRPFSPEAGQRVVRSLSDDDMLTASSSVRSLSSPQWRGTSSSGAATYTITYPTQSTYTNAATISLT